MRLLVLFFLFTQTLATCPRPPPTQSTFTLDYHLPSLQHARHFLTPSRIIPLLFGPTITNYHRRHRRYTLFKPHSENARLRLFARRHDILFVFVSHTPGFFPVNMKKSSFKLSIDADTSTLYFSFRGTRIPHRAAQRRNVFAKAFAQDLLMHARLVLGMGSCSASIPTYSGFCNNVRRPRWGATNVPQLRRKANTWLDLHMDLPNPRFVSNALCKSSGGKEHAEVNFLMVIFGQFVDHDIVLTPSGEQPLDASFETEQSNHMHFLRSDGLSLRKCCNTGYQKPRVATPFNRISAYLDASAVYGHTFERAYALRRFVGGELKMVDGLLPRNSNSEIVYTVENANRRKDERLFAAGDMRANENPVLTALHTLFALEHNRVCGEIRDHLEEEGLPVQSDEWMYTQARRIVMGELQCIVYEEWLPMLVGDELEKYEGYDEDVDAGMGVLFTTAAFRWGHSAIRGELEAGGKRFKLEEAFFNPGVFEGESVGSWLKGAMKLKSMEVDLEHEDSIREFLFSPGKSGVLDLVALNLQRGRDHRLPGYLEARRIFGLSGDFRDMEDEVKQKLLEVYKDEEKIDVFVGGLAERKDGRLLGALFRRVVAEQFERLRNGDRFYYEWVEWGEFMSTLPTVQRLQTKYVRLKDVIRLNTDVDVESAFHVTH